MTTKSFWISVEDDLPKYGERVLVVCVNWENHAQRHVSIAEYWGDHFGKHPIIRWSGNKLVSHWARLPELPNEDKVHGVTLDQLRDIVKKERAMKK